jgi:transposase-like protein
MVLATSVDPDTYYAVVELARREGVPVSELLRRWIMEKLSERPAEVIQSA